MENTNQWSDRVLELVKKSPCNKYIGNLKDKAQTRRPNNETVIISEQKNLKP